MQPLLQESHSYSTDCSFWQPNDTVACTPSDSFPLSKIPGGDAHNRTLQLQLPTNMDQIQMPLLMEHPVETLTAHADDDAAVAMAEMLHRTSLWPSTSSVDKQVAPVTLPPAPSPSAALVRCSQGGTCHRLYPIPCTSVPSLTQSLVHTKNFPIPFKCEHYQDGVLSSCREGSHPKS